MSKSSDESTAIARRGAPAAPLEDAIGGREALVELLESSDRNSKQDILFRLLCDPARSGDSLQRLCQDAGVSATEVLSMFRDASVARSLVQAQRSLADRLETVVNDVADKAADHVKPCRCVRLSPERVPGPNCPHCGGYGKVYAEGSLKHAELVFKSAGLTKEGGGVSISMQQNVAVASGGGFLDKFVKATDQAAFDIIEARAEPAEVIDEPEGEPS